MTDLIGVLKKAGFKGKALKTAYGIAMRESHGNPQAFNPDSGTKDRSWGLFQINTFGPLKARVKQYGLRSEKDLLDPEINARVAYRLSKGGTDFGAWGIGPNAYRPGAGVDTIAPYLRQFPTAGGTGPVVDPGFTAQPDLADVFAEAIRNGQWGVQSGLANTARIVGNARRVKLAPKAPVQSRNLAAVKTAKQGPFVLTSPLGKDFNIIGTPLSGTHGGDDGFNNWQSMNAWDFSTPEGTPVYAASNGTIGEQFGSLGRVSERSGGFRLTVDGKENSYYYGHLSGYAPGIQPGERVSKGQLIGYTGVGNGVPHLHFAKLYLSRP